MNTQIESPFYSTWTIKAMAPKEDIARGQVSYWDYYAYPNELRETIQDTMLLKDVDCAFTLFEQHEYHGGLVVKHLRNLEAETVRINNTHRLAFTTINIQNRHVAVFYLLILNHKLEKHRDKLKLAHIQTIKSKVEPLLSHHLFTQSLMETPMALSQSTRISPCFHEEIIADNRFIELSTEQSIGLQKELPFMQSGEAGVGKTTIMDQRIDDIIHANCSNQPLSILCITGTGALADYIEQEIQHDVTAVRVYHNWIQSFAPEHRLVNDTAFDTWYRDYVQKTYTRPTSFEQKKKTKSAPKTKSISTDSVCYAFNTEPLTMERLLYTFKHFAGRNPQDVSNDDILFPSEFKEELIRAYYDFLDYLNKNQLLHPAFFEIPTTFVQTTSYDLISVEEGQNFTLLQIQNLFQCAKQIGSWQRAFQITFDSQQMILFHKSHREDILQLMIPDAALRPEHHHILHQIERSLGGIVQFADRFISRIKYPITQERGDKYEDTTLSIRDNQTEHAAVSEEEQQVLWVDTFEALPPHFNYNSGRWLIITNEPYLNEASVLFGSAMTIREAIGLQADYVCLYRIFDDPHLKAINTQLKTEPSSEKRPIGKAKKNTGYKEYTPSLNGVGLAMLRAIKMLVILQEDIHALDELIERIKPKKSSFAHTRIDNTEISIEALRSQLRTLLLNEQFRAAQDTYVALHAEQRLGLSFQAFYDSLLNEKKKPRVDITVSTLKEAATPAVITKAPKPSKQAVGFFAPKPLTATLSHPGNKLSGKAEEKPKPETTSSVTLPATTPVVQKKNEILDYLTKLYHQSSYPKLENKLKKLFQQSNASEYFCFVMDTSSEPDVLSKILNNSDKASMLIKYLSENRAALRLLYDQYVQPLTGRRLDNLAAYYTKRDLINLLIESGCDVNRSDAAGFTTAYYATIKNAQPILLRLKKHAAPASLPLPLFSVHPESPLCMAIDYRDMNKGDDLICAALVICICSIEFENEEEIVKLLTENSSLANEFIDLKGTTLLQLACQHGHAGIVKQLLSHGASVNHARDDGTTALMIATRCRHTLIMQQLLDAGAMINATMSFRSSRLDATLITYSALDIALTYQFFREVHLLLSYGAVLPNFAAYAPRLERFSAKEIECIQVTLKHQSAIIRLNSLLDNCIKHPQAFDKQKILAELNLSSKEYLQASFLCQMVSFEDSRSSLMDILLQSRDKLALFVRLFGDIRNILHFREVGGKNILHYAAKYKDGVRLVTEELWKNSSTTLQKEFEMLDSLVSSKNQQGRTPFHDAVMHQQKDNITYLYTFMRREAINTPDNDGNTALHLAVQQGYIDIALCLIKRNASLDAKNQQDLKPLDYASSAVKERLDSTIRLTSPITPCLPATAGSIFSDAIENITKENNDTINDASSRPR